MYFCFRFLNVFNNSGLTLYKETPHSRLNKLIFRAKIVRLCKNDDNCIYFLTKTIKCEEFKKDYSETQKVLGPRVPIYMLLSISKGQKSYMIIYIFFVFFFIIMLVRLINLLQYRNGELCPALGQLQADSVQLQYVLQFF